MNYPLKNCDPNMNIATKDECQRAIDFVENYYGKFKVQCSYFIFLFLYEMFINSNVHVGFKLNFVSCLIFFNNLHYFVQREYEKK